MTEDTGIPMLVACFFVFGSFEAQADEAALLNIMEEAVQSGIPGLSAAIADEGGILWTGVAGQADVIHGTPIREEHLLGVGSITKTFVAVVALQLVEERRLHLDQTPLAILGPDIVGHVANSDISTIAQLLNHTSGIPSWEDDPRWIQEGRGEKLDVNRLWNRQDTLSYVERTPPTNAPGEEFSYANTNHTLVGLIIEKITGHTLVDEIRRRILVPVGLSEIFMEGFQDVPHDKVAGRYHYATPEFVRVAGVANSFVEVSPGLIDVSTSNLSVEWAAGGMMATARDLARYALALSSGKLLRPESMAFLQQWFSVNDDIEAGHGIFRLRRSAGHILGHSGSVLGFTGFMYWHEEEHLVVVMLANVGTMHIGQDLPGASSVVLDGEFLNHALKLAKGMDVRRTR